MSRFDMVNGRLNILESKTRCLDSRLNYRAFTSDVDNLKKLLEKRTGDLESKVTHVVKCLEFQVSRHDELQERFEMLMNHLGLRVENDPRIVKDK